MTGFYSSGLEFLYWISYYAIYVQTERSAISFLKQRLLHCQQLLCKQSSIRFSASGCDLGIKIVDSSETDFSVCNFTSCFLCISLMGSVDSEWILLPSLSLLYIANGLCL